MIMTRILKIDSESLKEAQQIITSGGVVAFPTETVYGLGANAFDTSAVNSIFEIKGRPNDNPLIVHVHRDYDISELVFDIPDYAVTLAKKFLPGPLTMVYKSRGKVSSAVSCGMDTLAIRIPSHEGAQKFLKYLDLPIAAPSANISKHVSPTSARHVYADLNGKIDLILDGGPCYGGIESTVLDCTSDIPVILRSGLISQEMIKETVGECGEYVFKEGGIARSPGMKYRHYSPRCKSVLYEYAEIEKAVALYDAEREKKGTKVCILCDDKTAEFLGSRRFLSLGKTPEDMAANLYSKLRECENDTELLIAIAPDMRGGIMVGVMNRLSKACGNSNEN